MREATDAAVQGRRAAAALLGLVVVPIAIAATGQPLSVRGWVWLGCGVVATIALATGRREARWVVGIAGAIACIAVVLTLAWPSPAAPLFLERRVLPSGEPASAVGRLISERDASLVAPRLLRINRGVSARELDGFGAPLAALHDEMEARDGAVVDTPLLATLLGRQRASRFDVLVHDARSERWVVFLHGTGGSVAASCWVVARAAEDAGWSTICPATAFEGRWERGEGPAIVRQTIDHARARGARTIVLAGLSQGAVGASRLAPALADELTGLALISGLDGHAEPIERPTWLWHGTGDERFAIARARAWAQSAPHARLVEVSGDHFALIELRAEFSRDFASFLSAL